MPQLPDTQIPQSQLPWATIMPDMDCRVKLPVTSVDELFGTHTLSIHGSPL